MFRSSRFFKKLSKEQSTKYKPLIIFFRKKDKLCPEGIYKLETLLSPESLMLSFFFFQWFTGNKSGLFTKADTMFKDWTWETVDSSHSIWLPFHWIVMLLEDLSVVWLLFACLFVCWGLTCFHVDRTCKRNENTWELIMVNISFYHPLFASYFIYSIVKHHSNYEEYEL